jgi:small nuclear ribonucleoprotein (snRNP)-like protein
LTIYPFRPLEFLKSTLSKSYRIIIHDGRMFIGNLSCIDKERNIVLVNTEEFNASDGVYGRWVGMVLIPWRHVVRAEVEGDWDQSSPMTDDDPLYTVRRLSLVCWRLIR